MLWLFWIYRALTTDYVVSWAIIPNITIHTKSNYPLLFLRTYLQCITKMAANVSESLLDQLNVLHLR